jgi:anti-sigma factor RsiW
MPMSEEDRLLVHAYLDGELDFTAALALEKRIAGDQALMAERDSMGFLLSGRWADLADRRGKRQRSRKEVRAAR